MNMFAVTSKNGEPRRAQLLTAAIAECGILLANVDYIAPIITMSVSSSHVPHRGPVATPLVHPTPPLADAWDRKFREIIDNIPKTVQDRDIVSMED